MIRPVRYPRWPDEREDVISTETWNGGSGTVTFNYLQQREPDNTENDPFPETTDIWNIASD